MALVLLHRCTSIQIYLISIKFLIKHIYRFVYLYRYTNFLVHIKISRYKNKI